ncbi:translocator protein 2 [Parasteatoda tepidariorum]|nr:translocator protein 2 [Parasteatoda tepidariorum]
MNAYIPIASAIALPHVGGILTAFLTRKEIKGYYEKLKLPSWRPPNYVFGPVWTTLYTGMGYASYLVYRDGGMCDPNGAAQLPLRLYYLNLALNWSWSIIFFKLHKRGLALAEILALWVNIGACVYTFYPVNKTAAYLMLPYWAWVTLASSLTYCIWRDNKDKKD